MSPRDNQSSKPSASTQSPIFPSSSSTNNQAAVAAVLSNLADSIDTVADHFSPVHSINPVASGVTLTQPNQPTTTNTISAVESNLIASSAIEPVRSNQVDLAVVIDESNQGKAESVNQQQLMNDTITVNSKNTLFGHEMPFDVISAGYAALVATGGIIGYVKAGSIPSLAAGLTFGGILGIGAYMTSVNPDNYYLTLATSTGLGGLMGYRFLNSGKFMPAGLIALLSIGMVARIGFRALTSAGNVAHVKE